MARHVNHFPWPLEHVSRKPFRTDELQSNLPEYFQLIFGFKRLGFNTMYSMPETTKKAGIVVESNTTCTFLSLVQWIGWRIAIVAFT